MDEHQLEKAFEALGQLRKVELQSAKMSSLIELVERKLEWRKIVFKDCDSPEDECESGIPETGFSLSVWHAAAGAVQQLISEAEEETRSRPGCLPLDPGDCELMGLVFSLRDAALGGYWVYETKLNRGYAEG